MHLTKQSFKIQTVDGRPYFAAFVDTQERGPIEICLEPCLEGYCVAAYDKRKELIGDKLCTKTPVRGYEMDAFIRGNILGGRTQIEQMDKAAALANEVLAKATGKGLYVPQGVQNELSKPSVSKDQIDRLVGEIGRNVASRLDAAMFRALPVWVKRWERYTPAAVRRLIAWWYSVEIRHYRDEKIDGPVWELWVRGRLVERVVFDKRA